MTTGKTTALTRQTFAKELNFIKFPLLLFSVEISGDKEPACSAGDLGSVSGLERYPGEGNGNLPVFFAGESHGQRSLEGCSPWDHKELGTTERLTLTYYH